MLGSAKLPLSQNYFVEEIFHSFSLSRTGDTRLAYMEARKIASTPVVDDNIVCTGTYTFLPTSPP